MFKNVSYSLTAEVTVPDGGAEGVKMTHVVADQTPFRMEYQPGHPAANKTGYVKLPNVDPLVEALDMREAQPQDLVKRVWPGQNTAGHDDHVSILPILR